MLRRDWFPALGFGGAVALALALCAYARRAPQAPTAPRTLYEMAQMAERLGLHHRSDLVSGMINNRLVISDYPLTFERANSLHVGDPEHPCWRGTVAACGGGRALPYLNDAEHGVLWGEFLLYGDPDLIRRLLAAPILADGAAATE